MSVKKSASRDEVEANEIKSFGSNKMEGKRKKNDTKREECVCGQEGDLKGLSEYIVWDK